MPGRIMKPRAAYFFDGGKINREAFCDDIKRVARDQNKSIPVILGEFLGKEVFTAEEIGLFALYTSARADLVDSAVTLIHALGVTEASAPSLNILVTYFGARPGDSVIWGFSFNIDTALNWKLGTVMPAARKTLESM